MAMSCAQSWSDCLQHGRLGLNVDALELCEPQAPQGFALVQRQLADEAFALFEVSPEYEFKYSSIEDFVSRIEEIYTLVDVNAQSGQGDTLLMKCVSNLHMAEEDPASQLRLVRFLLESGADPNMEDSLGETALDWLVDCHFTYNCPLTAQQRAMIELLVDFGGRVYRMDNQGHRLGKSREHAVFCSGKQVLVS
jgi:Ankyrin repeats (many copies)